MSVKEKPKGDLWRARLRKNLKQKTVAFLLGHKNQNQLSDYERGRRVPVLESALRLEIIYSTPIQALFPELYDKALAAVNALVNANAIFSATLTDIGNAEFCSFAELLKSPKLSQQDFDKIRPHAKFMTEEFGRRLSGAREPGGEKQDE